MSYDQTMCVALVVCFLSIFAWWLLVLFLRSVFIERSKSFPSIKLWWVGRKQQKKIAQRKKLMALHAQGLRESMAYRHEKREERLKVGADWQKDFDALLPDVERVKSFEQKYATKGEIITVPYVWGTKRTPRFDKSMQEMRETLDQYADNVKYVTSAPDLDRATKDYADYIRGEKL